MLPKSTQIDAQKNTCSPCRRRRVAKSTSSVISLIDVADQDLRHGRYLALARRLHLVKVLLRNNLVRGGRERVSDTGSNMGNSTDSGVVESRSKQHVFPQCWREVARRNLVFKRLYLCLHPSPRRYRPRPLAGPSSLQRLWQPPAPANPCILCRSQPMLQHSSSCPIWDNCPP